MAETENSELTHQLEPAVGKRGRGEREQVRVEAEGQVAVDAEERARSEPSTDRERAFLGGFWNGILRNLAKVGVRQ